MRQLTLLAVWVAGPQNDGSKLMTSAYASLDAGFTEWHKPAAVRFCLVKGKCVAVGRGCERTMMRTPSTALPSSFAGPPIKPMSPTCACRRRAPMSACLFPVSLTAALGAAQQTHDDDFRLPISSRLLTGELYSSHSMMLHAA